ncbi:MAG TPA: hypothetical protein VFV73_20305 [Streptosporangiaceae bacterium]|nr:hypothetical protein [Streptosporangiaceae bacterium]
MSTLDARQLGHLRHFGNLSRHLADELTEQWDPVVRDNIMYSACAPGCAACRVSRARGPSRSPGWPAGAAGRSRLTAR